MIFGLIKRRTRKMKKTFALILLSIALLLQLLLPLPSFASDGAAIETFMEPGCMLTAVKSNRIIWTYQYPACPKLKTPVLAGPATIDAKNSRVHIGAGPFLMALDLKTGKPVERWRINAVSKSIEDTADGMVIESETPMSFMSGTAGPQYSNTLKNNVLTMPIFTAGYNGFIDLKYESESIDPEFFKFIAGFNQYAEDPSGSFKPAIKRGLDNFKRAVIMDPTNPWNRLMLGAALKLTGDSSGARASFEMLPLKNAHLTYLDHLDMAIALDGLGETKMADALFDHAYAEFLRSGHSAKTNMSYIGPWVMILKSGSVHHQAGNQKRADHMIAMARKYSESNALTNLFGMKYEQWLVKQGRPDDARRERGIREASANAGYIDVLYFVGRNDLVGKAVIAMTTSMIVALLFIALIVKRHAKSVRGGLIADGYDSIVKTLHYMFASPVKYILRHSGLAYMTIAERAALSVIAASALLSFMFVAVEGNRILRSLSMPLGLYSSELGNPDTLSELGKSKGNSAPHEFILAFAEQSAGNLNKSENQYAGLAASGNASAKTRAMSFNNLAVIHYNAGKKDDAINALKSGIALMPEDFTLNYNLGRMASDKAASDKAASIDRAYFEIYESANMNALAHPAMDDAMTMHSGGASPMASVAAVFRSGDIVSALYKGLGWRIDQTVYLLVMAFAAVFAAVLMAMLRGITKWGASVEQAGMINPVFRLKPFMLFALTIIPVILASAGVAYKLKASEAVFLPIASLTASSLNFWALYAVLYWLYLRRMQTGGKTVPPSVFIIALAAFSGLLAYALAPESAQKPYDKLLSMSVTLSLSTGLVSLLITIAAVFYSGKKPSPLDSAAPAGFIAQALLFQALLVCAAVLVTGGMKAAFIIIALIIGLSVFSWLSAKKSGMFADEAPARERSDKTLVFIENASMLIVPGGLQILRGRPIFGAALMFAFFYGLVITVEHLMTGGSTVLINMTLPAPSDDYFKGIDIMPDVLNALNVNVFYRLGLVALLSSLTINAAHWLFSRKPGRG